MQIDTFLLISFTFDNLYSFNITVQIKQFLHSNKRVIGENNHSPLKQTFQESKKTVS